jgi:hypothetical protein
MNENAKKKFNWRSFVSVLTALSFIGMTFTGIILFVVPPGRIANWTGWTILALTKQQWIGLHDWFSIIFVVASIFHLYLNWKPFVSYFKSKVTKAFALRIEWAMAMVICIVVFAGTLSGVRPFSLLFVWSENIKHSWDDPRQRAPIPHAELLSLAEIAEQTPDINLESILSNLKAQGIEVESSDVILEELAETYNMKPVQLYEIALGQTEFYRGGAGRRGRAGDGRQQGGGFGRMILKQYCEQMDLDLNTAEKKLKEMGFTVNTNMTIRDIADSMNVHPSEIHAILQSPRP